MSRKQSRVTGTDLEQYWKGRDAKYGSSRTAADPEGLTHSVDSQRPTWSNRAFARLQRRVFERLLKLADGPTAERRALDVGTGTGRWAKLLATRGYTVSAFDLGEHVIAGNRRLMPEIDWHVSSIEDFSTTDQYDLVSCVGVISYGSLDEQRRAAAALRSFVRPEGHLILLEAIRYSSPMISSRPVEDWTSVFAEAGFSLVSVRPYGFLFGTRTIQRLVPGTRFQYEIPGEPAKNDNSQALVRSARTAARAMGLGLDYLTEPVLLAARRPSFATNAGFLFRANSNHA